MAPFSCPAFLVVIVLASALSAHACDTLPAPDGRRVDFTEVQRILTNRCTSCHAGAQPPAGLDLSLGVGYFNLVDKPSTEVPSQLRVKPGSSKNSYLFKKINCDAPPTGDRMPQNGALPIADQVAIRDWIDQGAQLPNRAPTFTSAPSANPNPARAANPVTFNAATTDRDEDPIAIAWSFGDGTTATGLPVTHTFSAPGVFTVTATATDGRGGQATASVDVVVEPDIDTDLDGITDGADLDDDNDGFSDEFEIALSTSPIDAASTPLDGAPAGATAPLTISKLDIRLIFSKPASDSISVSGRVPVPAGFDPLGKVFVLDAGGVIVSFTLDAKGLSPKGTTNALKVGIKRTKGSVAAQEATFAAKLSKGDFAAKLAGEGLDNADRAAAGVSVAVTALFNKTVLSATVSLAYSAKAGKSGKTKRQ